MKKIILASLGILVAAVIFTVAVTAESDKEFEKFLNKTDAYISRIEREHENDEALQRYEKKKSQSEQAAVEAESAQAVAEKVYIPETETYCDPLTTGYESSGESQLNNANTVPVTQNTYGSPDGLGMDEFYEAYEALGEVSWNDCVAAAQEIMGMDEYSLLIAAGWTVNEGYTWYDPYLAYLCAMCPWHYYVAGQDMADGLAGWDYTGTYSEENLAWLGYLISGEELKILYLAITSPYYCIYGCDGLSWYSDGCIIYEEYINGYTIRVWSY